MRWHTKPITQLVIMFVVMSMVIGAQSTTAALLTGNTQKKNVAKVENTELVNVQAGGCIEGDDAPLGDTYGMTPAEKANMLNRWPINGTPKDYYFGYDIFGVREGTRYTVIPLQGSELTNAITIRSMGNGDPKSENLLGSIFGYTPDKLKDAFDMKYPTGMGEPPNFIHGDYPGVRVPASIDTPIMAPNLPQYPIGGGFGAMVVYADTRKITLHIGRHEYVNTAFDNSSNCGGAGCRGGYWIYIENICVANRVLASYRNAYQNFQQNAQADKNPIKLPMVRPGQVIGKTTDATGVRIVVVDSGPIVAANDTHFWKAPVRPFSTGTPPVGSPTVPPGGTPTVAPTAPPAGPTPGVPGCFFMSADVQNWQEAEKAKFNVTVKYHSAGGDGDIMLEKNDTLVAGWNGWDRNTNNPYVYGPEWTGGVIEVDPGQSVPVKFTGHVANSVACPGVRANMNCTFNGDGTCSCGGTSCQALTPPTPTAGPTAGPTIPVTPPPNATATPTPAPGTPTPVGSCPSDKQWRYTCTNNMQIVEASCLPPGGAYTWRHTYTCSNTCPSGTEVWYFPNSLTDVCSSLPPSITPTPDPNTPGISATINQIVLTFFGTCSSNPLCNRLTILHGTAYNGRLGQFDSDPGPAASGYSDFGLGEYMGYSQSGNETRFTLHMNIPILSYDEWKTTTLLLPDPNAGAADAYVIKP